MKKIEKIRHSLAHIMALAVKNIYSGKVKFGVGPVIENGFYYDFDFGKQKINPDGLLKIEGEMTRLIKQNLSFKKMTIALDDAIKLFKNLGQNYKIDLLNDLKKFGTTGVVRKKIKKTDKVSIYAVGDFKDLCRGPHIKKSGEIELGSFKLVRIAGAYWRGDERKPMLTRIYGAAFETGVELENYLKTQEEIVKRDHRILGEKLDLFLISEEIGPGLILWKPKGALIRKIIEDFWKKEHELRGYQLVYSPHIANLELWKKSGHYEFYREMIYPAMDLEKIKYLLKPMNCPFHAAIYKSGLRSYRELPLRLCELGTVYRYEKTGTLHGLLRVRGFTQDDAHIFIRERDLEKEILSVLDFAFSVLKKFGFSNFSVELAVRDPKSKKYLGSDKIWKKAELALIKGLKAHNLKYKRGVGEAVFYGPKIDIKLVDSLGREWQGPTIQVDFNFPEKFNLFCANEKGQKERIVMIHRTLFGSLERFLGVLLEHYNGALPFWFSPIQVMVIPIAERHLKYAALVVDEFKKQGYRTEIDSENEMLGKKIHSAEIQKIPYIIVIGDKEIKDNFINIRDRDQKTQKIQKLEDFLNQLKTI